MDDYKPRLRKESDASGVWDTRFPKLHVALALGGLLIMGIAIASWPSTLEPSSSAIVLELQLPATAAQTPIIEQPSLIEYKAKRGDSIGLILQRIGLNEQDRVTLLSDKTLLQTFKRLQPDHIIKYQLSEGNLAQLEFRPSKTERLTARRENQQLIVNFEQLEYARQLRYAKGRIESSLFMAGLKSGLSETTIMRLAAIFQWDIDFTLDIRENDSFEILQEELFIDGEKVGDGEILYASFENAGFRHEAVRHVLSNGRAEYFSSDGRNLRKTFLRSPVDFARISSHFNLKRKHPILHKIRAHKGVDYAAARGTPIKAVGDGRVTFAGTKGGYGKVVILQHGTQYSTLYAHMNNFGRGIKVGTTVKQGQVIGYVGSSGMATGPHLHYEFQVNGVHKDPLKVKMPAADPIPESEKAIFAQTAQRVITQKNLLSQQFQLAQSDL